MWFYFTSVIYKIWCWWNSSCQWSNFTILGIFLMIILPKTWNNYSGTINIRCRGSCSIKASLLNSVTVSDGIHIMSIRIRNEVTHYCHICLTATTLKLTKSDNLNSYAFLLLNSTARLTLGMNKSYGKQKKSIMSVLTNF